MNQAIPALSVRDLTVYYRDTCALQSISVDIAGGSLLAIAGPNGGGKSTFIKSVLDLIPIYAGSTTIFGKPFSVQRSCVAYIPQRLSVDWDFPATVLDVVLMGRYPHLRWFARPSQQDREKAFEAIHQVGLSLCIDRLPAGRGGY